MKSKSTIVKVRDICAHFYETENAFQMLYVNIIPVACVDDKVDICQ